jgi:hypothetical protein
MIHARAKTFYIQRWFICMNHNSRKYVFVVVIISLLVLPVMYGTAIASQTRDYNHSGRTHDTEPRQTTLQENTFTAKMGMRGSTKPKVILTGHYRNTERGLRYAGEAYFTDSDWETRFQGGSTARRFIIGVSINGQITVVVGRYTSFNPDDGTFTGIWQGINGRLSRTAGWIEGNLS